MVSIRVCWYSLYRIAWPLGGFDASNAGAANCPSASTSLVLTLYYRNRDLWFWCEKRVDCLCDQPFWRVERVCSQLSACLSYRSARSQFARQSWRENFYTCAKCISCGHQIIVKLKIELKSNAIWVFKLFINSPDLLAKSAPEGNSK